MVDTSKVAIIIDETFEDGVLKADKPVLLDFTAEWCGPCKALSPILDEIADERSAGENAVKIAKIYVGGDGKNRDSCENPEARKAYGIQAYPTLMVFREGKIAGYKIGGGARNDILNWIDETLARPVENDISTDDMAEIMAYAMARDRAEWENGLRDNVAAVTDDGFDAEVMQAGKPVLILFRASSNADSQRMDLLTGWVAAHDKENEVKFVKLDVDRNSRTAQQFLVASLPGLLMVRGGKVMGQYTGADDPREIIGWINGILKSKDEGMEIAAFRESQKKPAAAPEVQCEGGVCTVPPPKPGA